MTLTVVMCCRRLTQLSCQHKLSLARHLTGFNIHGFSTHRRPGETNGHTGDQQRPGQLLLIAHWLQSQCEQRGLLLMGRGLLLMHTGLLLMDTGLLLLGTGLLLMATGLLSM